MKTDEVIALLETDKTVIEFPAPISGVITVAPVAGAVYKPGQVVFEIAATAGGAAPATAAAAAAPKPAAAPAAPAACRSRGPCVRT